MTTNVNIYSIKKSSLPLLVVFHENYNIYWVLTDIKGIASWKHILMDNSMNGFLIYPRNGSANVSFSIQYSVQSVDVDIIYGPLSFNLLLIGLVVSAKPTRKKIGAEAGKMMRLLRQFIRLFS